MSDPTIRALIRLWRESGDPEVASRLAAAVSRADDGKTFGIVTIPMLGSRLTLAEPWTFDLFGESRNTDLWILLHGVPKKRLDDCWKGDVRVSDVDENIVSHHGEFKVPNPKRPRDPHELASKATTLPPGTVLRVDRIYIRAGGADFDSVTFVIETMPNTTATVYADHFKKGGKRKIVARFWAKLHDVNKILCDWHEDTVPREAKGGTDDQEDEDEG